MEQINWWKSKLFLMIFLPRCQKWTPTGGVVVAAEWRTFETARKLIAIIVLFWLFPLSGGQFSLHISQDGLEAVLPLHLRHVYPQEREEIVWALNLIRKIESIYRCFVRVWPIIVCIRLEHQGWIILLIADSREESIDHKYIARSQISQFFPQHNGRFMGKNNWDSHRCKLYAAFHLLFASPYIYQNQVKNCGKNVQLIRINTWGLIVSQQHKN